MRSAPQRLKPHAIDIRVNVDLKNAYRVLLTRARQGMVIFVPPGAKRDKTRSPGWPTAPLHWRSIMPPLQRMWCKDRLVAHGLVAM
jgi:hypothetical protein